MVACLSDLELAETWRWLVIRDELLLGVVEATMSDIAMCPSEATDWLREEFFGKAGDSGKERVSD